MMQEDQDDTDGVQGIQLKSTTATWKQDVVSQNPLMGKLLQPEFDQASFLYNMYKSCTVGEIEDFKMSLQEVREGTVKAASKNAVTSKSTEISQLVKDMLQLDSQIRLKLQPAATKLDETSLKIQHSLLAQIQELQSQASRLVITQKCEEIVRETQLVFEVMQKVGFAYNYAQRKILDPLSLSVALKQLSVLSLEQKQKLAVNIPQIASKLDLIYDVQQTLEKQTITKFQEAFENKDRQSLVQCIQVFFNMEILSDQIQSRTNVHLKQLHAHWNKKIKDLNEQVQQMESQSEEAALIDKTFGVFIEQMGQSTMKVYTMSLALSEQDPTSAATTTFEAMQETLQQTGLSNVFRLYWDMLCKILRMRLQASSTEFPYVFSTMAAQYPSFLHHLKRFWDLVIDQIQPTDKIRLLELKQSIFASSDVLKKHYFENVLVRQLMECRMQISEILTHSFENLDKYKIVTQQKKAETKAKIINPYMSLNDSFQQAQDLKTQEKAQLRSSVESLLKALHVQLETVKTQLDLRSDVIEICKQQLASLLQTDLLNNIVKFNITEAEADYEHQLGFNMVIFDMGKQVATYFSSAEFGKLLEADDMLQVAANSAHINKSKFSLRLLQKETQEMCSKLFEKVYAVFISHLKTQIYPAVSRSFAKIPKPLKEDDLDFGGGGGADDDNGNGDGDQEDSKDKENSKSFDERLQDWRQEEVDELYSFFIPSCVKHFNDDFAQILTKMSLYENASAETAPAAKEDTHQKQEWVLRERKVRLIECVDEILHFFVIKSVQMDLKEHSAEQRDQLYNVLKDVFAASVSSFADLVEVKQESRMVQKHLKFLEFVKEDNEIEEAQIPFHINLCLGDPSLKAIQVRNLYICEKGIVKAGLLGHRHLAKNAAATYEKTLQEIKKQVTAAPTTTENQDGGENKADAQTIIELEEKIEAIDKKLAQMAQKQQDVN